MTEFSVKLSESRPGNFSRGASLPKEWLWRLVSGCIFQSPFVPFYSVKRVLLRCFGAKIGKGVVIKPRVTITFPWKLTIGEHSWIGEEVFLDSLDQITIEKNVCISQGAYLCTGNHDYRDPTFSLVAKPIYIEAGVWVAARSLVGPGVRVGALAVLAMGTVATKDVDPNHVCAGNPAVSKGLRIPA